MVVFHGFFLGLSCAVLVYLSRAVLMHLRGGFGKGFGGVFGGGLFLSGDAVGDVETDLAELWKRIVFNICIHNTDDHLRNHGFLLGESGWRLSPAYDLNPHPWAGGLALNVDDVSNACDLDLAWSVGRYFRLSDRQQAAYINEVREAVAGWNSIAESMGISRGEIERMRVAFETGG